MLARFLQLVALAALSIALACSEQRPLYPVEDELAQLLHEPFEDQEAEELALELSAEIVAPEDLYARLHRDLVMIRTGWSDSVSIVNRHTFHFRSVPGEAVIFLQDEMDVAEWLSRTTELGRIREQYGFDTLLISDNRITLRSRYRLNTAYVLRILERLPGVCWAQTTSRSIAPFGAAVNADTIDYVFFEPGWCNFICTPSRYTWFSSDTSNVKYLGQMFLNRSDTIPDAFKEVWNRRRGTSHADKLDSIVFRDETPPARATDVKFIGDQVGRAGMISFTATGDDGNEGAAYSATVCVSTNPIITDDNFNTVGYQYVKVNPGFSGDEHVLSFDELFGDRTNYYAVRFIDCNQNLSRVSNIAESRNIWLNGWTYFTAENSPLPDNRITSMIRDSRGRLWLGTFNGLGCKDGELWQVYQTSNSGIPFDLITSVAEGPDGTIWVGTPHGLGRFDGEEWQSFTTANSDIPKQEIRCLAVANDGTVWLGYGQYGLVRYYHELWTVYTPSNSPLAGVTINGLMSDSRGVLWIATNKSVNRLVDDVWTEFDVAVTGVGGPDPVGLFEDASGTIWCGTSLGNLSWFDGEEWYSQYFNSWHIKTLTQFEIGPIWVGAARGIWRFDGYSWLGLSGATTGLPANHCTGLIAEEPGALWIATYGKGLCRWDLRAAKLDSSLPLTQMDK